MHACMVLGTCLHNPIVQYRTGTPCMHAYAILRVRYDAMLYTPHVVVVSLWAHHRRCCSSCFLYIAFYILQLILLVIHFPFPRYLNHYCNPPILLYIHRTYLGLLRQHPHCTTHQTKRLYCYRHHYDLFQHRRIHHRHYCYCSILEIGLGLRFRVRFRV